MDLNKNSMFSFQTCELTKNDDLGDTTLRLNCLGHGGSNITKFAKTRSSILSSDVPDDGCRLVLGLGPTPTTYRDYCCHGLNKNEGSSSVLHQGMLSESDSILKLGLSGGTEEVLGMHECSVSAQIDMNAPSSTDQDLFDDNRLLIPVVDEGSTSAKKSGGYMPSLLLGPRVDSGNISLQTQELEFGTSRSLYLRSQLSPEPSITTEYSMDTISEPAAAGTSSDQKTNNPKKCKFWGCSKGARGASGLCIGHGGGQRCQKAGCNKGAESRTAYCKAHGGGKRCQHLGCTKSAEGKTDYCIAHGGGRRCGHPGGCTKAARGKSGLCIRHGGGKRCQVEGCTRSAEGLAGLCISHGGGRRCKYQGCTKGAQGSTMFCKAHGGGKRCIFAGCTKGAEGSTPLCKGHGGGKRCLYDGGGICPKSVHGGTNFCVAHGGGKRCAIAGCTKSARGRTDCCVRHGGGKRCRFENCGKSAQGSTNFCKAHGGGKRCSWLQCKCEKFARGKSGLCAAHTSMAQEQERATNKRGITISDCADSLEQPAKCQHLIPHQVLVPQSMKSSSSISGLLSAEIKEVGNYGGDGKVGRKSLDLVIPEGRVHGGGLMSFFGGNLNNAIDGI
ncbi:uncharacterized protein LOC131163655 isoform X2 [Malania oleifera]|uniref:uncharacterized protein LOC131163655 isoform X2 n=1 Tax=Malania oleifera TaxID=397392 RepID=UPI0025ADF409|nr:uncharacterized protein LOC131163655 isoform X2 [Malania oleifera]XP_057976286.1 uncharacterized protein LOC131163655 isoform X2 [Malania oleifera]XP_057976287.1 uncharacterized protein LOC131163655 isoform X2 [Malania oleifera]